MARKTEAKQPSILSKEFIEESDSSDDETSTTRSVSTSEQATKNISLRPPTEESDQEDESEPGEEPTANDEAESAPTTANIDEPTAPSTKRKQDDDVQEAQMRKRYKSQTTSSTARVASKPFSIPKDYTVLTSNSPTQQPNPQLLQSKLAKKQIWYITAPKSLDLGSLGEIDLNAAVTGVPLGDQDGVSYNLSEKTAYETTLLQLAKDRHYRQSKHTITKTYHIYTATRPTKAESSKEESQPSFTAVTTGTAAKPRAQPKGLRMRYQPFGPAAVALQTVRAEKRPPMTAVKSRVEETNGKTEDLNSSVVPETPPKKRTKLVDSTDQSLKGGTVVTVDHVENGVPGRVRKKKKKKSAIPGEVTV